MLDRPLSPLREQEGSSVCFVFGDFVFQVRPSSCVFRLPTLPTLQDSPPTKRLKTAWGRQARALWAFSHGQQDGGEVFSSSDEDTPLTSLADSAMGTRASASWSPHALGQCDPHREVFWLTWPWHILFPFSSSFLGLLHFMFVIL